MQSANHEQEGGRHYQTDYQHWDFVNDCLDGRYLEGNLTKYVYRWKKKNGLQDVRKALHYLLKIREFYEADRITPPPIVRDFGAIDRFCLVNDLGPLEARIMKVAATWEGTMDIDRLQVYMQELESLAEITS